MTSSPASAKIMEQMREQAPTSDARTIGVQIVDVRLKRVDLPNEVSESVYRRMEAERKRVANELRSQGRRRGRSASAQTPIASARSSSPRPIAMRRRSRARAMPRQRRSMPRPSARNREFYAFYRSLEAYRSSFSGKDDVLVVDPSSDFFRFMKDAGGASRN
jgi:membrane protease subunit HflC